MNQLPASWSQVVLLFPVLFVAFRLLESRTPSGRSSHVYSNSVALCWMQFNHFQKHKPALWEYLSKNSHFLVEEPGEIYFSSLARTIQPDTSKDSVTHLHKAYLSLGVFKQFNSQVKQLLQLPTTIQYQKPPGQELERAITFFNLMWKDLKTL